MTRADLAREGPVREGRVRGLGTEGDGAVVLADGAVVLVRGALPGERVRIAETGRGRVRRGRLLEVLVASPERATPACALSSVCGGCPLMHASAALQAEVKLERVRRALEPFVAAEAIRLEAPTSGTAYRTRARLAWSAAALGYRGEGTRSVVDAAACVVLRPVLEGALGVLRERVRPHLTGEGEIRLGSADGRGTVALESREPQGPALYRALEAAVRDGALAGATVLAAGATAKARFGVAYDTTEDVEARKLSAPLGGFGQAHGDHNRALGAYALELAAADGARVLELYAGHGNFTLALAGRAESVHAVELDAEGAACLRLNLDAHGLAAEVTAGDAAAVAAVTPRGTIDVVLLDPPREGARDLMAPLVSLAAARLVYVSCHPESLARDLAMLVAGGYRVSAGRAFDMFPQTAHVEVVVQLERAGVAARPARR